MKTARSNRVRKDRSPARLGVEMLEGRQLLSCNIFGAGILQVRGDDSDNHVVVNPHPTDLKSAVVRCDDQVFDLPVPTGLIIDTKGGDDVVLVDVNTTTMRLVLGPGNDAAGLGLMARSVRIDAGAGDDDIDLFLVQNADVPDTLLKAYLGTGDDRFSAEVDAGSYALDVRGGLGNDAISLFHQGSSETDLAFRLLGDAGDDAIDVVFNNAHASSGIFTSQINGGAGDDDVSIQIPKAIPFAAIRVLGGTGDDSLHVLDNAAVLDLLFADGGVGVDLCGGFDRSRGCEA